jgi:pimeloyl-ACP methyl ester carboxylesterase
MSGLVLWARANRYVATEEARRSAASAARVNGWFVFKPERPNGQGFVFYPGGLVEAEAYAPMARALSERGILTVVTPMPLDLAVLNPNEAGEVIAAFPEIQVWAVGGHSLGGAMGGAFLDATSARRVSGLVLWAARLSKSIDLRDQDVAALSIYGSHDGVTDEMLSDEDRRLNLPPAMVSLLTIEGGNHSMFGDYGLQTGDNAVLGDAAAIRTRIIDETAAFIGRLP